MYDVQGIQATKQDIPSKNKSIVKKNKTYLVDYGWEITVYSK